MILSFLYILISRKDDNVGEIIVKPRTLKSGKVVYEYAFEIASVDGKRKTKCGFKTKKEAREAGKLAQQTYEQVGQAVEPSDMSFADFLDQWLEMDCKLSCKDVTVLWSRLFVTLRHLHVRDRYLIFPF